MKKIQFLILAFSFSCLANAQSVKGYVFSLPDNKPVEFANVLILNLPDSVMAKGVVSYPDGQYSADNIKPGKYYIKSSFVGYNSGGIAIEVNEGQTVVIADTIFLTERTNQIDDVVVKGDLIRAKELVDRTVYEILPEIEKTSTNGYDVLKKIPSVQVDFNNNVTLNGKSNFIIQVDGKQRDKEFLARILPGDIESVEIIHNPSGKYDGSIEGVINVVLKKEARVGINGNFGVQAKPVGKATLGSMASLDYGREKITFYVSGYTFVQNLNSNNTDYQQITIPRNSEFVDSSVSIRGNGDFSISASAINTGFDYYYNEKNNISINYSYKPFQMSNELANTGNIMVNNLHNFSNASENSLSSNSGESNISLFYRKKYKKPIQEFTVESNYYFFNSTDNNSFFFGLYHRNPDTLMFSNERDELAVNHRKYFSTKADYVQPIGVSMRLEGGYQFYWQGMDYNSEYNSIPRDNYIYSEIRNAAYASFFWNLKDFSAQTTLRVENSQIDINKEIPSQYSAFLPSANLMYKFSTKQNLKFTYNRRINRPDIYNLNPFEKLENDLSVSSGNQNLEPEIKDRLQLTYTLNIKKINFSPYIYQEYYSDKIANISVLKSSPLSDNYVKYNMPGNVLTGYERGLGLNTTLWSFNINGSVYQGHYNAYTDSLTHIDENDYFSFRLNSFVYAPVFKTKINAFAFINYNGVNISGQSKFYSALIYGFGAQQNIKNHSYGIFYLLPLSNEVVFSKTITETPQIYSENKVSFDASWFIQLMYSYKFNKGRAIKKTERKSEIESDTKGGGIGR
ncbi:MAG: TonB-dependent receptor [Bacteroidales bacterium]|nr:TonB-dependent receptor [Bacteroidales bacterium]